MEQQLRREVEAAAGRSDVAAALASLYADVQARIDQRRPVCVVSGRCCRFEEYGHRLFVTTIELAGFVRQLREREGSDKTAATLAAWDGAGCPFQVAKLCSVHAFRPFGCRMFFCDATSTHWQNDQYEQFHARLKSLHETLHVPYFYCEWRTALRMLLA